MENGAWNWNDRGVRRYLGMGAGGEEAPEPVRALIEACKEELMSAASPKAVWREFSLTWRGDGWLDFGCFQTRSRDLSRNLRDCTQAVLFAATLGAQVDRLLGRYGKLDVSRAVVLQAAAASMLETFCDQENERLKAAYAQKGLYLRPRFSPGYGDFPLTCQRPIAAALDLNRRLGVTLTESFLMAPSKSVTAVIGASPIPGNCRIQGCEACKKTDCLYRRETISSGDPSSAGIHPAQE